MSNHLIAKIEGTHCNSVWHQRGREKKTLGSRGNPLRDLDYLSLPWSWNSWEDSVNPERLWNRCGSGQGPVKVWTEAESGGVEYVKSSNNTSTVCVWKPWELFFSSWCSSAALSRTREFCPLWLKPLSLFVPCTTACGIPWQQIWRCCHMGEISQTKTSIECSLYSPIPAVDGPRV